MESQEKPRPKPSFRLIQMKVMKINLSTLLAKAEIGASQIKDITIQAKLKEESKEIKEMLEDLDFMIMEEKVECGYEVQG